MREMEKKSIGISKTLAVIVIAAIIIVAAATAGWWFYLRPAGKKESTLDLALFSKVPSGENQTISGSIEPAVADALVTLTITRPDSSTFNRTVTSESDGSFTYTFTVEAEGNWTVVASWPGNSEFEGATSDEKAFTVVPPVEPGTSVISCFAAPSEVERGESVVITGQIWTTPTGGGAGVTVTLTFTDPDGATFNETVTSESDGSFTYAYTVESTDVVGWWEVIASWAGTDVIEGAVSDVADFHVIPVFTGEPIKIGVIRNLYIQGDGMEEASIMAAEDINEAGGILGRKVILAFGDEGTEAATGTAEITRLITEEDVDFIVGGFRTEILYPMREVAMDYKKIFITTGAATNELYDCFGSLTVKYPCGHCVRCDYERYKYMFRVMPPNSTLLFLGTLVPYLKYHLVPEILGGSEESPIKVAAVVENLAWADVVASVYDNKFRLIFGWTMDKTTDTAYRPSHTETNFESILTAIRDSGAQIIIHVFSGEAGLSFIKQWGEMQIPAVAIGINVLSQQEEMWDWTDEKCEYEAVISSPPRVNMTAGLIPWWDRYIERWGHAPIYTSLGTYDAVYTLKFGIEKAGTIDSDAVVAALEGSERDTLMGRAGFTKYHDVLIKDTYPMTEHKEWVTPLIVQWRAGQREVIFPSERSYTTEYQLPPWISTS